ncbi:copper resistance protein B [Phenylobacterium sp.]|jgi:copper resistance protein B|uniref:copper resistance protein B n=1 Tax=Phenylobacterium sp. TaxID=1871053 RepID=UPI000C9215C4|nr:copper resistance protein B [Phenylobacterium sp.]MAK81822.1 copper resistance protein CopB [Phenylobacterium sp.]MCA6241204.1 copper resistance protein B [Phenylobacterium sp.]|tara:strand:+ start:83710 stop:84771 length:1062 start_codon:yes stop_codon:yes gene_type:complete
MIRTSLLALALASAATAAAAQAADPHAGHAMPAQPAAPADPHAGHAMPAAPEPLKATSPSQPTQGSEASAAPADPHAGHAMPAQPAVPTDPHAGHTMAPMEGGQTAADLPVGNAPGPAVITDNVADQVFGSEPMQRARGILADEHGGSRVSKLQADLLEWAPNGDRYSWEVEGWYGGDINRFVFKTEGEGQSREGVEAAEVQLLYSRAVARYTDVQVGIRYDLEPRSRAYATLAVDAMFPYWFEAEGSLFLSEKGDLLARVEGSYDFRLTQRLILQPRAELEFAAQDIPESEIGSGLSTGELGLRLRYEIRREFAPYIGVSYERAFGDTAGFVRARGEDVKSTRFVVGLRAWF